MCLLSTRFQVEYVLSEPGDSWEGRKGRVDETMLKDFINRPDDSKCYVCVCGPTAFNDLFIGCVKLPLCMIILFKKHNSPGVLFSHSLQASITLHKTVLIQVINEFGLILDVIDEVTQIHKYGIVD